MNAYDVLVAAVKSELSKALSAAGFIGYSLGNEVTMPERGQCDLASSVAFKAARAAKKTPIEIAAQICSKMGKVRYVREVKAENGFINFYLDRSAFSAAVISEVLAKKSGITTSTSGNGEKVIIEYPSVNPNKPWHIGHLRNALIGDTVSNLYAACGYSVEREDYIDDMGLQVVENVWGVMNLRGMPAKKYDHWLGEMYVEVNRRMEDKEVKEQIGNLLTLIEQGDTYEAKFAREMAEQCVSAQRQTAYAYGIYHDVLIWESDIMRSRLLETALGKLAKTGVLHRESEGDYNGCTILDLKKAGKLPSSMQGLKGSVKVLVRSNGTAVYAAKDIAFHMWKFGMVDNPFRYRLSERQPNNVELYMTSADGEKREYGRVNVAVNIIDMKQAYEQNVVKLALSLAGKSDAPESMVHLAYNVVELEGGAFSGRKGTWVGYTADDLLSEGKARAERLVTERLKMSGSEKEGVICAVALAAIKFEMLHISPERKIVFSWGKALTFEGLSGPYCLYMHARAARILENADAAAGPTDCSQLATDEEFRLVKLIAKCGEIVEKARSEHRSNVLTDYAGLLAAAFSKFYERYSVIEAESEELKSARIALVQAFKYALGGSLSLLGIRPLDRM